MIMTQAKRVFSGRLLLLILAGFVWMHAEKASAASEEEALQPPEVRILVFGDSLAHGYGLAEQDTFPVRLESLLQARGFAASVVNAGLSGDTTAGGLARLPWILEHESYTAAVVILGGNDALRGLDPQISARNLDAILQYFQQKDIPVLLAGMMAPRNMGKEYAESFDSIYPMLSEKHHIPLYPFFLEEVAFNPARTLDDGLHPNARGNALIARRILPYLSALLPGSNNFSK